MKIETASILSDNLAISEKLSAFITDFDLSISVALQNLKDFSSQDLKKYDIIFIEINSQNIKKAKSLLEKNDTTNIVAIYEDEVFCEIRKYYLKDYIQISQIDGKVISSLLEIESLNKEISSVFCAVKSIFHSEISSNKKIEKIINQLVEIQGFDKVIYFEMLGEKIIPKYNYEYSNKNTSYSSIGLECIKDFLKECEPVHIEQSIIEKCGLKNLEYGIFVYIKLQDKNEKLLVIDLGKNQKYRKIYFEFLEKVSHFLEIEEQKIKNEERLKESDGRFKLMLENSRDSIVAIKNGVIEFANKRFLELTGSSIYDVLGTHSNAYVIAYKDEFSVKKEFKEVDFMNNSYSLEMRHGDGSTIFSVVRGIRDFITGDEDSVILFINDITNSKIFQNQIEENKNRLDKIISSMDDISIFILDKKGNVVFVRANENNDKLYGMKFSGTENKNITEFLPNGFLDIISNGIFEVIRTTQRVTLHYKYLNEKTGAEFWFDITISPTLANDGKDTRIITVIRDITQIKRAEQEAYRSAKYLEEVFNNVGEGVFILNKNWTITDVNRIFLTIFDYEKEEVLGENFSNIFTPRGFGGEYLLDIIREEISSSNFFFNEYILKKKVAKTFYGQIYITGMLDKNGDVVNYVGSIKDITKKREIEEELLAKTTEAKKAEEQVRSMNEYLKNIFNNMNDVVLVLNPYGNVKSCNGSLQLLLGMRATEMVGENINKILGINGEFTFENIDGEYTFINHEDNVVYLSVKSTKDKFNQIIVTIHDITPIKVIQFEIEQNEFKFRTLFEVAQEAMMFANLDGEIFDFNKSTNRILGFEKGSLYKLEDVIHKDDLDRYKQMMENIQKGNYSRNELRIIHNKEVIDVELSVFISNATSVSDDRFYVYIMRDITEYKRVNALKDEFVSVVSHELKTPITSIDGSLRLLLGGIMGELPQKVVDILKLASRNSVRLIELINDILDIQKMETGEMKFVSTELKLSDVIVSTVEECDGYVEQYGVSIKVGHIDDVYVFVDKLKLIQLITNLLSNGIKFSEKNSEVLLYSEIINDYIRIHVIDKGVGIPDSFKDKVFNKFSQSELSITRKIGGSGLGLSIAKEIVEKFGGKIDFKSELNKGTDFYFELPIFRRGKCQKN